MADALSKVKQARLEKRTAKKLAHPGCLLGIKMIVALWDASFVEGPNAQGLGLTLTTCSSQ